MSLRRSMTLGFVVCWFVCSGLVRAQETVDAPSAPAPVRAPNDVPCLIDATLSQWLALESVDRTIAALEFERRDLAGELASMLRALDLLAREADPDGVSLVELGTLVQAKAAGRDALEDTYAEIQNRLIDIDQTLKRRRKQQAMLEARVEELTERPQPAD